MNSTKAINCKLLINVWILQELAFCHLSQLSHVEDADERIASDVNRLTDELAMLFPSFTKPLIDLAWYLSRSYVMLGARGIHVFPTYVAISKFRDCFTRIKKTVMHRKI